MKILYITYENVFRTGILQAMVVKPLLKMCQRYDSEFYVTSTLKNEEKDEIYYKNKVETENLNPALNINEFGKDLKSSQSVLTFVKDIYPILRHSLRMAKKSDLIHCRGYGGALIGYVTSIFSGKPFIFDMRGTLPEETVEVGKIHSNSIKFTLLKITEKILVKKAHTVFTVSDKFENYIRKEFKKDNVVNINNPTDFSIYYPRIRKKNEPVNFIYSGSMQIWHVPETTIAYYSELYKIFGDKIHMIFCTNEITQAKKMFEDFNLPDSAYEIESVPFSQMPLFYERADIAFCFIRNSFSKSICFPVKFSEYVASEIFVLTNDNIGDLDSIIRNYNCGLSFKKLADFSSNIKKISTIVESILGGRFPKYDREKLRFLDWNHGGIEKIHTTYCEILKDVQSK